MNSYERFSAFARREPIDRPMRYASFTPDLERRLAQEIGTKDFATFFKMDNRCFTGPRPPADYKRPDFSAYHKDLPPGAVIGEMGVAHKPGGFYHFTEYISPLRNASDIGELEEYPIEDCASWDTGHMAAETAALHEQGRYASLSVCHMYEQAWQIRGYEPFLEDMALRPDWAGLLLDRLMSRNMNRAVAGARAGVDMLYCGDDVASQKALMFSPGMWREFMKSRWAKVWAAARAIKPDIRIWYHSDGNIEAIIGELIEIGATILNPIQPECMDIGRIYERWGDRVLFDGAIGTQSVLPFGTPEQVRECVRERVGLFGQNLILSPTHTLEPEVPIPNIMAFFDECDKARFG